MSPCRFSPVQKLAWSARTVLVSRPFSRSWQASTPPVTVMPRSAPATPWEFCCKSPSWTHQRLFWRTSVMAFVRFTRRSSASTRFQRPCRTRTRTSMFCWLRWERCKRPSMQRMPGTWTRNWNRPWTLCVAHPQMLRFRICPGVKSAELRCVNYCSKSPTCYSSMSPPTTWTRRACCGWNSTCPNIPAL